MELEVSPASRDLELLFINGPNPRMTEKNFVKAKAKHAKGGLWVGGKCLVYDHEKLWVKKGAKLLIEKVKPGSLLEIGFGLGFTATQFQEGGVKKHVILEPNKSIFKQALAWKRKHPRADIEIYNLFSWEFKPAEKFDLVYDDRYDLVKLSAPTIKEFERFCRADTCVGMMPIFGKAKVPGNSIFFKFNGQTYTQPRIAYGSLKRQLKKFFYADGAHNYLSLRILSQLPFNLSRINKKYQLKA